MLVKVQPILKKIVALYVGLRMKVNKQKIDSNEELAKNLATSSSSCKYCKYEGSDCTDFTCYSGILQWLNQES